MKNNIHQIIKKGIKTGKYIIMTMILILASCNDYLNEPAPTNVIATTEVFKSPEAIEVALNGIYGYIRDASAGGHDSFSIKSFQLGFSLQGDVLMVPVFNWFIFEYLVSTWTSTSRKNNFIWDIHYGVINNANNIIANVPEVESLSDADKARFVAEARAIRAWAYFNLVRVYQFTYSKDPQAPSVPVYETPASPEVQGNPRAPISEVYDLITADLEYAIANLDAKNSRVAKFRINLSVAQGIYARVLLEMQNWQQAATVAASARTGYSLMNAATYQSGFNDIGNAEWMWGLPFNAAQSHLFASFYSFIDHERSAGYKDIYMSKKYADTFEAGDVRGSLIVPHPTFGIPITRKFRDLPDNSGDYVMMRASEMYLIEAEALAEQGLLDESKTALNMLRSIRGASPSTATTKDVLITEILLERKKELYGEIGIEFFDHKRRQLPLVRELGLPNHNRPLSLVDPDDPQWNNLIVQSEIDANESISDGDQNPTPSKRAAKGAQISSNHSSAVAKGIKLNLKQ